MFNFLWNLQQSSRLRELESRVTSRVASAGPDVDELKEYAAILQDRIDKVLLINMAMWSIIEERLGLTEDDLARKVQEIDLRDGVADGRPPRAAAICAACNRPMSARHQRCLYCGSQTSSGSPFAGV